MAQYRMKPVEAEQYRPGLEDGFVVEWDPELWNGAEVTVALAGDDRHEATSERYSIEELHKLAEDPEYLDTLLPYIDAISGREFIRFGDWIVTRGNGVRSVVSPEIFKAAYEPVKE